MGKKKMLSTLVLAGALLVPTAVIGKSIIDKPPEVNVEVNNVKLHSSANSLIDGKVFVDVREYTDMVSVDYTFNKNKSTITINGTKIPVVVKDERLTADVEELANATGAEEIEINQESASILDLPDGVVKWHPVIPGMGQHWIQSQEDMENPPFPETIIYGSYGSKIVFIEQMVPQDFFEKGGTIRELDGMAGKPSPGIDHTDIEFQPEGHPGLEVPHFDIHHYYVSHEEHLSIPEGHTH